MLVKSITIKYYILTSYQQKNKIRRWPIHPINRDRQRNGEFYCLYPKLREHPEKFQQYQNRNILRIDASKN